MPLSRRTAFVLALSVCVVLVGLPAHATDRVKVVTSFSILGDLVKLIFLFAIKDEHGDVIIRQTSEVQRL